MQKGLRLKFLCGNRGYNDLLEEGLPYPALRTLRRSIQDIQFESGILEEIFYFMKTKVECMKETERICCLTLDEMKLQKKGRNG